MPNDQLLPCPFCGKPPHFTPRQGSFAAYVACVNESCGIQPESVVHHRIMGSRDMKAIEEIAAERQRQIEVEGWTPEHDDTHDQNELAYASACYAVGMPMASYWPWDARWWKPDPDRRRRLVKAGALIVAEIERLDRGNA